MKTVLGLLLLCAVVLVNVCPLAAGENGTPVVVELFTSEACSSCPPADALLTRLSRQRFINGAEVFVLGEHVDYFNHTGWTDRFSSALFSERQQNYADRFQTRGPYTPQVVINGRFEGLGSDAAFVERTISRAIQRAEEAKVTLQWTGPNALQVNVAGPAHGSAVVLLAITEDGLQTSVASGENRGRLLQHSGVVRELRQLGSTSKGVFEGTAAIVPAAAWKADALHAVVFVQRRGEGDILGAAAVSFRH